MGGSWAVCCVACVVCCNHACECTQYVRVRAQWGPFAAGASHATAAHAASSADFHRKADARAHGIELAAAIGRAEAAELQVAELKAALAAHSGSKPEPMMHHVPIFGPLFEKATYEGGHVEIPGELHLLELLELARARGRI